MKAIGMTIVFGMLALASCGEKKQAHLERFLQPGREPAVAAPAPLDPFAMVDNPEMADRINSLGFAETVLLLGAHRFRAQVKFEFRSPQGYASLAEEDEIVVAANGDFSAKVENDAGQGFYAIYAGGHLWVQNRFAKFHPRSTLAGEHLRLAQQAFGSWAAVYRLFRGRLDFLKVGLVRIGGREAVKFSLRLSGKPPRFSARLPAAQAPEGAKNYLYAAEPTPSEQEDWRDRAHPASASGTLWADVATGVVLGVEFRGGLEVERAATGEKLELEIEASVHLDGFGQPPALSPPRADQLEPIPERIPVDTHPLDFYFGKGFTSTLGPPAGVAARPKGEETN